MKRIVLLSGGLDSATCLGLALEGCDRKNILALNIYYGQRHAKEMQSARDIARHYEVELNELDLSVIFQKSNCSLLSHSSEKVAEGSYYDQQKGMEGKPVSTYVPFRNGLMLSAAASIALSIGAKEIWYGAHADDAAGNAYPDCSPDFYHAIDHAIYEGSGNQLCVIAPFINMTKADIVKKGLEIGVPYEMTWSCYNGGEKPCGVCGTCIDRAKAFEKNGVKDPAI